MLHVSLLGGRIIIDWINPPPRMPVPQQDDIASLVGNPNLNLHLPLASRVGGVDPNHYINHKSNTILLILVSGDDHIM